MDSTKSQKSEAAQISQICSVSDPIAQVFPFPLDLLGPRRFIAAVFLVAFLALSVPAYPATSDLQRANSLFDAGNESYRIGDIPGASQAWSQALPIYQRIPGMEQNQATCLMNIGLALGRMGQYKAAISNCEQALKAYQAIPGTERNQAACVSIIGTALGSMGQHEAVISKCEQALKIYQAIPGTEWDQATCLKNIGVALRDMGQYEAAISRFEQALRIFQTIKDTGWDQAACLLNIGLALRRMGQYEADISKQEQALEMLRAIAGTEREQATCLRDIGYALQDMGQYQAGISKQEQALKMYQPIKGTEPDQARCLANIGLLLLDMDKFEECIAKQEQALKMVQAIAGTEEDRAACLANIGLALGRMGQYEAKISKCEQALKIYQAIPGTKREQAACLVNIGLALGDMDQYEAKISRCEQALKMFQAITGTERDQAACLSNIGVALKDIGQYEAAISKCEQALKMYQAIEGTEREEALCFWTIGTALRNMGQYKAAISRCEQALKMYQTMKGTEPKQAGCLRDIGVALGSMGQYEADVSKQEQALKMYQAIEGTERQQAACLVNIGNALGNTGQHEARISKQEQALKLLQSIPGAERDQAACLGNIGLALWRMGQYKAAISKCEQALKVYQTIRGTERDQAACLVNIGLALGDMDQHEAEISKCEQALKMFQTIAGTGREQSTCWGSVGEAHRQAGQWTEAIAAFREAVWHSWWISHGLGLAYHQRGQFGDPDNVVRALGEAVLLAEDVRQQVTATEHRTGIFEDKTVVFADLAGILAEYTLAGTRTVLPDAAQALVTPSSPSAGLEAAFHYADRGKGRALLDALREKAALKSDRADTKLLAGDRELSLRVSKLASMRDELPDKEADRKNKLTQDIEGLQQRRNMIEVELKKMVVGGYVAPEFRKPMDMAKELEPDTAVLQYSIGEKEEWLLILTRDGVTAHKLGAETQALPELLPRQQASISQLVEAWNKRPDKVGLDGLVHLARARVEDLGKRKASERHNLVDAALQKAILERLGEVVLPDTAQLELQKKGIHHLLVIPDGSLHYIPFSMLRIKTDKGKVTGQYLVEQFAISYIPAMTTLDTIRKQKQERQEKRKGPRRELLAFANPDSISTVVPAKDEMTTRLRSFRGDYYKGSGMNSSSLPEAETEAIRVASLFGPPREYRQATSEIPEGTAVVYIGKGASEEEAKQLLTSGVGRPLWRYLLFSTHALADTQNGMLSCIKLSPPSTESQEDGFLQAQEVMGLELDADLVMLSACQTGLGRLSGGEGLVGLTGAFFYAGAESVCASLWQVPTEPTGRLGPTGQVVTEFFRNLKEGKVNKAEALRQAQLQVIRQGQSSDGKSIDYSDPFCWAAWQLYGEWR